MTKDSAAVMRGSCLRGCRDAHRAAAVSNQTKGLGRAWLEAANIVNDDLGRLAWASEQTGEERVDDQQRVPHVLVPARVLAATQSNNDLSIRGTVSDHWDGSAPATFVLRFRWSVVIDEVAWLIHALATAGAACAQRPSRPRERGGLDHGLQRDFAHSRLFAAVGAVTSWCARDFDRRQHWRLSTVHRLIRSGGSDCRHRVAGENADRE